MNDESLWEKADDARWEATDQGYPPGHPQREYHLEILRLNQFDWLREYSPNREEEIPALESIGKLRCTATRPHLVAEVVLLVVGGKTWRCLRRHERMVTTDGRRRTSYTLSPLLGVGKDAIAVASCEDCRVLNPERLYALTTTFGEVLAMKPGGTLNLKGEQVFP